MRHSLKEKDGIFFFTLEILPGWIFHSNFALFMHCATLTNSNRSKASNFQPKMLFLFHFIEGYPKDSEIIGC